MKRRSLAAGVLLLIALVPWIAPAADVSATPASGPGNTATSTAPSTEAGRSDVASSPSVSTSDGWMGAAAAILCGLYVKATIATGGSSVGTIAGAVAACTFMVFEALTQND